MSKNQYYFVVSECEQGQGSNLPQGAGNPRYTTATLTGAFNTSLILLCDTNRQTDELSPEHIFLIHQEITEANYVKLTKKIKTLESKFSSCS